MSINTINRHAVQLIKSHLPTRFAEEPRSSHNDKNIVPRVHETRLRFNTQVQLSLQWRGFTQTITMPHFITCKQLWLWLSDFIIRKITHSNSLEESQFNVSLSDPSPHNQLHPTQLVQLISIYTHDGLDIRLLPRTLGQCGNMLHVRISCPTGKQPKPKQLTPPHTAISTHSSSSAIHSTPLDRSHPYSHRERTTSCAPDSNHQLIKPSFQFSPQLQLIPNFTLIELYTNSGQCFPIIIPRDAPHCDILLSSEVHVAALQGLLPSYQGEPCHHNETPLHTLADRFSSHSDCDPIITRGCRRRRNNNLSPSNWAAQVSRDLAGYTTSIAVFLAWLSQGAEAHNHRSPPTHHISFTLPIALALAAIALTFYIHKLLARRYHQKQGTRLLLTTIPLVNVNFIVFLITSLFVTLKYCSAYHSIPFTPIHITLHTLHSNTFPVYQFSSTRASSSAAWRLHPLLPFPRFLLPHLPPLTLHFRHPGWGIPYVISSMTTLDSLFTGHSKPAPKFFTYTPRGINQSPQSTFKYSLPMMTTSLPSRSPPHAPPQIFLIISSLYPSLVKDISYPPMLQTHHPMFSLTFHL